MSCEELEKIEVERELDLSGEVCPVTAIKTRIEFKKLSKGEKIKVILTSKESAENVGAEFRKNLLAYCTDGRRYILIIKR